MPNGAGRVRAGDVQHARTRATCEPGARADRVAASGPRSCSPTVPTPTSLRCWPARTTSCTLSARTRSTRRWPDIRGPENAANGRSLRRAVRCAIGARAGRDELGRHRAETRMGAAYAAYEKRFGRIYLVAAAGLSATELLAKARARLGNDPGPNWTSSAASWPRSPAPASRIGSHHDCSTHVLDAALGRPAVGVDVTLARWSDDGSWTTLSTGSTNDDGRCPSSTADLDVERRVYRLSFGTGDYFARVGTETFYPVVELTFGITSPGAHYHVPLLLTHSRFRPTEGVSHTAVALGHNQFGKRGAPRPSHAPRVTRHVRPITTSRTSTSPPSSTATSSNPPHRR